MIMFSLMMLTFLLKVNARVFRKPTALFSTTHKWTQHNHMIRPANKGDIQRIDDCNRANLPENYYNDFYEEHIHRFPELQLVALNEKQELMGYAMGRVEILRESVPTFDFNKYEHPAQYTGHVVSVALNGPYRGMGVAQALMQRLHSNLAEYYGMDRVNLFCRASNREAIKLYQEHLHYQLDRTVSSYYIDGEDALLLSLDGLLRRWEESTRETVRTANNCELTWQVQQRSQAESAALLDSSIITTEAVHPLPVPSTDSGLTAATGSSLTDSSQTTTTPKLLL